MVGNVDASVPVPAHVHWIPYVVLEVSVPLRKIKHRHTGRF